MGYLYSQDYLKQIQSSQLTQLKTGDNVLTSAELAAEAEVKSYLVQRYLIDNEFAALTQWSYYATYKAHNRVYLDATAYSATSTYTLNTLATYQSNVYRCTTAITVAEAWNANHWTLVGAQYAIYYAQYPNNVFDLYATYAKDDIVWYKDKRYKCKIPTKIIGQFTAMQYGTYNNIPVPNYYPDDATSGAIYWEDLGAYTIAANTAPTNTTYWTLGDNRNQQILMYTIDMVLYHLHCRIAPQNIPELRQNRYDDAKAFLNAAAKGTITLDMPIIQPKQGNPIRWGGDVKQINTY